MSYHKDFFYSEPHISSWKGITMADSYRTDTPYYISYEGRKMFFHEINKKSKIATELLNGSSKNCEQKPEIGYFFLEGFPLALAPQANISASLYLLAKEFQGQCLKTLHQEYLENLNDLPPLKKLAEIVLDAIDIYLLIEAIKECEAIRIDMEEYELFATAMIDVENMVSIEQLVRVAILHHRFLPWKEMNLRQEKIEIISGLIHIQDSYQKMLASHNGDFSPFETGFQWAKECISFLENYVSVAGQVNSCHNTKQEERSIMRARNTVQFPDEECVYIKEDLPILGTTEEESLQIAEQLISMKDAAELFTTIREATRDTPKQVRDIFDLKPYTKTHVQGQIIDFETVSLEIGGQTIEQAVDISLVSPSMDFPGVEDLIEKSLPIRDLFSKMIYPNICRFRDKKIARNGAEFSKALPLYEVTSHLFTSTLYKEKISPGEPVLIVVEDLSYSMRGNRTELAKILVAGISGAIRHTQLIFQAAVYGTDRHPCIEYLYHEKYIGTTFHEIAARIHNVENKSGQSDALCIYRILSKAAKDHGQGNTCFLVWITDQGYCKSFPLQAMTAQEELEEILGKCKDQWNGRLHSTVISINNNNRALNNVDKYIFLSESDLTQPDRATQRISEYVVGCIADFYHGKMIQS